MGGGAARRGQWGKREHMLILSRIKILFKNTKFGKTLYNQNIKNQMFAMWLMQYHFSNQALKLAFHFQHCSYLRPLALIQPLFFKFEVFPNSIQRNYRICSILSLALPTSQFTNKPAVTCFAPRGGVLDKFNIKPIFNTPAS